MVESEGGVREAELERGDETQEKRERAVETLVKSAKQLRVESVGYSYPFSGIGLQNQTFSKISAASDRLWRF